MPTINENLATLSQIKQDIKTAIVNKGVDAGDDITEYGNKINQISGGGSEVDTTDYLCFEAIEDTASTVQFTMKSGTTYPNLEASYDKSSWFTVEPEGIVTLNKGDKLYLRGDNPNGWSQNGDTAKATQIIRLLISGGYVNASGNIMSIMDPTCQSLTIPCDFCFRLLFWNSKIYDTRNLYLPATTLRYGCYCGMFQTPYLVYAPQVLPAMTLCADCYNLMFNIATKLVTAPYLPAKTLVAGPIGTTEGCYGGMFIKCNALQYIKADFTTSPTTNTNSATYAWVNGINQAGCFIKAKDATWTSKSAHACPSNWTLITSVS